MIRTLLAAAAVYACGLPAFDGHRPAALDKPLQGFYAAVNVTAADGKRALSAFDEAHMMRYLGILIQRLDAVLHGSK